MLGIMKNIYQDNTYLEHNPSWHAEDSLWKAKHIKKIIQDNFLLPNSVCELGCGAGEILRSLDELLPNCSRFFGYEISPQAYQICQSKKKNERVEFIFGNVLNEDVFFDIILAIDVFEHIEDYFHFLRSMKNKGKYKIFHIPLELSVSSIMRPSTMLNTRKKVGHIHAFSKETALSVLEETGYEVIDYFYTYGTIDHQSQSIKRNLAKLPRKLFFFLNKDLGVRILGGASLMVLAE